MTLAAPTTFSAATTSASFTSTSPWLLLAFLSLGPWFPWLPRWSALTILALTTLPVWRTSFSITTPAATASTSFAATAPTTSTIPTTTTSTLVGEGEVDVELLLASRSLEVDDGLLLFFVILLLILLLVGSCLFHLGSTSDPSPAFRTLNLGPSFLACMAFHWSKVICFSSSLAAFASSSSAVSSLGALGSSSVAASSLPSESTVVFASSPSLGTSSSKVPQLPLPPPPRLSSALIPVLLSPDFLSKSLLPPRPPSPPPRPPPRHPPSPPRPRPRISPLPRPRPRPPSRPPSSSRRYSVLRWLFLSSLGSPPGPALRASTTLFPSNWRFLWFSLSASFLVFAASFFTAGPLATGLVASSIFLAFATFCSASLCLRMSRGSESSSRKRA